MNNPVIILVGTKIDLREDISVIQKLFSEGKSPITQQQGEEKAKKIGARGYFECSSLTKFGVEEVFDGIIFAGLKYSKNDLERCEIL
jgi:GTPase SAR1 family protein